MDDLKTLLKRLELLKDIDPFNRELLNDCYWTLIKLGEENERIRNKQNVQTL